MEIGGLSRWHLVIAALALCNLMSQAVELARGKFLFSSWQDDADPWAIFSFRALVSLSALALVFERSQ
jgi:hypothetical protein